MRKDRCYVRTFVVVASFARPNHVTSHRHSVVFGGFAPRELAKRIDDAQPKALLATSCGIEPKGPIDYKRQDNFFLAAEQN